MIFMNRKVIAKLKEIELDDLSDLLHEWNDFPEETESSEDEPEELDF